MRLGRWGSLLTCAVLAALLAAACGGGSKQVKVGRKNASANSPTTLSEDASDSTSGAATATTTKKGGAAAKANAKKAGAHSSSGGSSPSSGTGAGSTTPVTVIVNGRSVTVTTAAHGGSSSIVTVPVRPTTPTTAAPCHTYPFDPALPVNLGCNPNVTPAEQARAEKLLRDTLAILPAKFPNATAAYNAGFRSIHDCITGDEHFINWFYVNDQHLLDPNYPESLVFHTTDHTINCSGSEPRTLEAAMFMMPLGSRFADVPDVGGQLTQWHIHDNLCLKQNPTDPAQQLVAGLLANPNDPCPAGTTKVLPVPMLHVWILKNKCGPFSALDGLGAGVTDGNAPQWCDTLHGSVFP